MRTFVESLRRNYKKDYITVTYLKSLLYADRPKITQEEYDYIISK